MAESISFYMDENQIQNATKQEIMKILPLNILLYVIGLGIAYIFIGEDELSTQTLIITAIFTLFLYFIIYLRQESIIKSIVITIDDKNIIKEQLYSKAIVIPKKEIVKIYKGKNKNIMVLGKSENIEVPFQIVNYEEAERLLRRIIEGR